VFAAQLHAHGIDRGAALELIAGVRSDAGPVALADDAELLRYCYRVAGTVGLMMCGVLGVRAPGARAFALDLGIAMQLTNICRDVAEDAARGRVYLPATRLAQVDSDGPALLRGQCPAPRDRRRRPRPARARRPPLRQRRPRHALHPLALAPRDPGRQPVYRAIGLVLRARDGDALAGRAVAPRLAQARLHRRRPAALRPHPPAHAAPRVHDPALHRHIADPRAPTTASRGPAAPASPASRA
jgi:phytoene synthase